MSAAAAYAVGQAYELGLSADQRRQGAHYTPGDVAEALVGLALEHRGHDPVRRVLDPSCGGGAFLVAACEVLVRRGCSPHDALGAVVGLDVDPGAVAASRQALEVWAEQHGGWVVPPRVEVADGLVTDVGPCDLVVGNPPFRSQLASDTVRSAARSVELRRLLGEVVAAYTDDAAVFLASAVRRLAPGGVCVLIQPLSTLAADRARGVRRAVMEAAPIVGAWMPGERVFGAEVDVWAPIVRRGAEPAAVRLHQGRSGERSSPLPPLVDDAWGVLGAAAAGVPPVELPSDAGLVAHVAAGSAGFRDEFYAVAAAAVGERPGGAALRLVTVGAIDPGELRWGDRPVTLGGRRWDTPWVELAVLDRDAPAVGAWARRLAVPKVVVAAQARVVEAVGDAVGDLLGVTPVVSLVPADPRWVPRLATALGAPCVSAWLAARRAGSGRSAASLRLGARDLEAVPLPTDPGALDAAVAALAAGAPWYEVGPVADAAFGVADPAVLAWWRARLPRRGRPRDAIPD